MKKILIAFLIIASLLLSSCDILFPQDSGSTDQSGSESNKPSTDTNTGEGDNGPDGGNEDKPSGEGGSDGSTEGDDGSNDTVATPGHVDTDNNGKCDNCSVSVLIELDFYVINDLHGKLTNSTNQPGVEELTTYLKMMRESEDNVFLLSSGDMWQGGSESNLTNGLIVTDWMNELGFLSMTLGNHEFDWGEEYIESNLELAEFPFLAINVYERDTNTLADYATPSVMVEQNGVKIGIIGAIGDCYSSISSDKVEDVYFKVGDELTALVKAESKRLRNEGADLIVYSLHDGYGSSGGSIITDNRLSSYYDPELSSGKYVDIVFEGHTHQNYVLRDTHGVYHIQNGGENKGIGHAEIMFNFANDKFSVTESQVISSSIYSRLDPDPLVDSLLEKYKDDIAKGNEVLGTSSRKRYSEELEQLVADLYLEAGIEKWGEEYNIFLGGGFLRTRSPYNLDAGEVRYSDLQMIFPFDNEIVLCSISGSNLKSRFINTTNEDYFISVSDYGNGLSSINDSDTYYVIVDSYTASYAPNRLTVIDTYDSITFARDLLAEYTKGGGLS